MKSIIALGFALLLTNTSFSQNVTETENLICWQAEFKFKPQDFTGKLADNEDLEITCELFDFCTRSTFDVASILDVPVIQEQRGELLEKAYFAPLFEKTTSTTVKPNDSIGFLKQKVLFDINELSARFARQQLDTLSKQFNGEYGAIALLFKDVRQNSINLRESLSSEYINEVYQEPKEGAYSKWRLILDEALEDSKQYQTTEEECTRLLTNKPLITNYDVSKRYN